ncbi:hypothetical protein [Companilactobacillus ginsenosidimutans]|nr:hypothetical protein [Companilactobacillus ginsenosidimutans]
MKKILFTLVAILGLVVIVSGCKSEAKSASSKVSSVTSYCKKDQQRR